MSTQKHKYVGTAIAAGTVIKNFTVDSFFLPNRLTGLGERWDGM